MPALENNMRRPLSIGLTGGVASGKSIAASEFAARQVPVLNADLVAREVVAPGTPALQRIREKFGADFIQADGMLDRRKMREHVFADAAARRALEQITHPVIRAALIAWRDRQRGPYCVLDVPILVESGLHTLVGRVLVIDCPAELQMERLMARDGVDATLAAQMLAAQASREQRLLRANDVIENTGPVDSLRACVGRLHEFYLKLSRSGEKSASGLHLP